ncbi:hypothetical protein [Thiolapillus sp.]
MEVKHFTGVVSFAETNLDRFALASCVNDGEQRLFVTLNGEVRENQNFTSTIGTYVYCLRRPGTKCGQNCNGQDFLFHLHLMKLLIN